MSRKGLWYTPIFLKDIAAVQMGPAERRGILDKGGAEVVGGVAISQYGANPMRVIKDLKTTIERTSRALPSKLLEDGRRSQLTIVPFYDRSVLIGETLNTPGRMTLIANGGLLLIGFWLAFHWIWAGLGMVLLGGINLLVHFQKLDKDQAKKWILVLCLTLIVGFLAYYWRPLGYSYSYVSNIGFVFAVSALILGLLLLFKSSYERLLSWALTHRVQFISIPIGVVVAGALIMLTTEKEFMPSLDEGAFLLMPVSMPHAGVSENGRVLKKLDMAVAGLPEVERVVGKAGRVE